MAAFRCRDCGHWSGTHFPNATGQYPCCARGCSCSDARESFSHDDYLFVRFSLDHILRRTQPSAD